MLISENNAIRQACPKPTGNKYKTNRILHSFYHLHEILTKNQNKVIIKKSKHLNQKNNPLRTNNTIIIRTAWMSRNLLQNVVSVILVILTS